MSSISLAVFLVIVLKDEAYAYPIGLAVEKYSSEIRRNSAKHRLNKRKNERICSSQIHTYQQNRASRMIRQGSPACAAGA
jgi:hypothetical protein